MIRAAIVHHEIDSTRLIREVANDGNGATSVFIGTVRSSNQGRSVEKIEYSAYEEMAAKEMDSILHEASQKFGVADIVAEHRVGVLEIGDASVVIAAAHPHRAPALDALQYSIEELKKRAPIWKLEHYTDGERSWVNAGEGAPR